MAGAAGVAGSSPLTRGRPRPQLSDTGLARLIPAHAGSTLLPNLLRKIESAHPRSRGVDQGPDLLPDPGQGSSPLTRGRHRRDVFLAVEVGLIPAHAGSTIPRDGIVRDKVGSSPLTRGRLSVTGFTVCDPGLIPAHAGSTRAGSTTGRRRRAHPRSRGVDALTA